MEFKENQKIVCVKNDWVNGNNITNFKTPVAHEIVTVSVVRIYSGCVLISLKEYDSNVFFPAKFFCLPDYAFAEKVLKYISTTPLQF